MDMILAWVRLQLVRERSLPYETPLSSPPAVASFVRRLLGEPDREHLLVLALSAKNEPLSLSIAGIGTLSDCPMHPREVFKTALLSNAASIILLHNHPSGCCQPSAEDLAATTRLQEAGKILGIQLLDHIILGSDCHLSLREAGVLKE